MPPLGSWLKCKVSIFTRKKKKRKAKDKNILECIMKDVEKGANWGIIIGISKGFIKLQSLSNDVSPSVLYLLLLSQHCSKDPRQAGLIRLMSASVMLNMT